MNKTKIKLELFEQPGIYWLLIDALRLFDKEVCSSAIDGIETQDIFYKHYIDKLKYYYQKELDNNSETLPIQLDIEKEIEKLKGE